MKCWILATDDIVFFNSGNNANVIDDRIYRYIQENINIKYNDLILILIV